VGGVIEKMVEAFFRHWMLVLLPIIVIPLDVTAAVLATPPQYEAQTGVWVERPTYLNFGADELTRYLPAATVQRNHLMELMRTRSFVYEVVAPTALRPLLSDPAGAAEIDQIFARDLDVVQTGDHLLVIQFRSEQQLTAVQVVNSLVDQFRKRVAQDRQVQAQLAISFYQGRQTDADTSVSQARVELAKYIAANPSIAQALRTGGVDPGILDPTFADLNRRVSTSQNDSDGARAALAAAQLDYSAGVQSDSLGFRVVDKTGVSATPSRQLRKALVYPIVALLAGVILGVALLLLLTLSDHSVRSLADLAPDMVILGVMPRLQPRLPRHSGAHLTRRAVGFVAGGALALRAPDRKNP
jgi:capsular polysaccharide biosynthesis protein